MSVTNHHEPLDSIEASLTELVDAERAGVFGQTPLPEREAWKDEPATVLFPLRTVRRLAIAAVIALAVGVWSLMFQKNLSSLRDRSRMAGTVRVADLGTIQASIAHCLGGPSGSIDPTCGGVDFDGDGDVDLADFRSFQVSYAVKR
ncbi:MAG: hypothetical protein AAB341_00280 [Planctomycetota bacterium]|jgi:hypothetical protein